MRESPPFTPLVVRRCGLHAEYHIEGCRPTTFGVAGAPGLRRKGDVPCRMTPTDRSR